MYVEDHDDGGLGYIRFDSAQEANEVCQALSMLILIQRITNGGFLAAVRLVLEASKTFPKKEPPAESLN